MGEAKAVAVAVLRPRLRLRLRLKLSLSLVGLQAMIAEWGYNLLEALYKYRHDADEEIFLYVLRNKMHEDFYHQQDPSLG